MFCTILAPTFSSASLDSPRYDCTKSHLAFHLGEKVSFSLLNHIRDAVQAWIHVEFLWGDGWVSPLLPGLLDALGCRAVFAAGVYGMRLTLGRSYEALPPLLSGLMLWFLS